MSTCLALFLALASAGPDVHVIPRIGPDWAELRIALRGGADDDPPHKSGLAHVAALVLETRLERLDPGAEVQLGRLGIAVRAGAPASRIERLALDAIDALSRPLIDSEVDAAVASAADARRRFVDHDRALAQAELIRTLFGEETGRNPLGSVEELAKITRDDVASFVHRHWSAEGTRIILAGRFDERLRERILARAARLERPTDRKRARRAPSEAEGTRVVLIDKPDRRRAFVLFGKALVAGGPAAAAADAAIGGALTARATEVLRRTPASAEYAFSRLHQDYWSLSVWSAPDQISETVARLMAMQKAIAGVGLTEQEILLGKRTAASRHLLSGADAASAADAAARAWIVPSEQIISPKIYLDLEPKKIAAAAKLLAKEDRLVVIIVASATADLLGKLVQIPGVGDVKVVRYDLR